MNARNFGVTRMGPQGQEMFIRPAAYQLHRLGIFPAKPLHSTVLGDMKRQQELDVSGMKPIGCADCEQLNERKEPQ
jgi:hypothetical protein